MEEAIVTFIAGLLAKYPVAVAIFAVVGVLRVINKPLFSFMRTFVLATPSPKDDLLLDSVEKSKAYGVVSYVLDWFGSVKIGK